MIISLSQASNSEVALDGIVGVLNRSTGSRADLYSRLDCDGSYTSSSPSNGQDEKGKDWSEHIDNVQFVKIMAECRQREN